MVGGFLWLLLLLPLLKLVAILLLKVALNTINQINLPIYTHTKKLGTGLGLPERSAGIQFRFRNL
jgi:hypothetical protein